MPSSNFEHLGIKSLVIYLLGAAPPLIMLFIFGIAILIFGEQLPPEISPYLPATYSFITVIIIIFSIIALIIGYLRYITYRFALDEDALHIERGIIHREIISIPYRQIQNINIDRDLFHRIFGLSTITITTAAQEETDAEGTTLFEAEGFLPHLDKYRAIEIQDELMKRTNVEKVISMSQSQK